MFSKKVAKLMEESAGAHSYGSTSNGGPSTETETKNEIEKPELASSAPAVLEPSKDASRPPKPQIQNTLGDSGSPPLNPWRTLVTCSCPEPSIRVPINTGDQTNDYVDEQQMIDGLMDDNLTTCSTIVYCYKNTAIKLRNSVFIHVFQALFSLIPISAIIMAVLFDGKCSEYELLPVFGGLTGIVGIAFTCFWMSVSCYNRLNLSTTDMHNLLCSVFFVVFAFSAIIDIVVFGVMSCSFDVHAPNYCNETFYYYAFYKHVATAVFAIVAIILYLPGSLHYLCCHFLYSH